MREVKKERRRHIMIQSNECEEKIKERETQCQKYKEKCKICDKLIKVERKRERETETEIERERERERESKKA